MDSTKELLSNFGQCHEILPVKELADFFVGVWETGVGCPRSWIKVMGLFKKEILPIYQEYRKGDIKDEAFKKKNKKKQCQ